MNWTSGLRLIYPSLCVVSDEQLILNLPRYFHYTSNNSISTNFLSFFILFSESPKNYAYKVRQKSGEEFTVCKVRGLTLNHEVSKVVNFDMIKTFVLDDDPESKTVSYPHKIQRQKLFNVVTKPVSKKYNRILCKRRVLDDYSTLPFGYVD